MSVIRMSITVGFFVSVALCQVPPTLTVQGLDNSSVVLSIADLAKMPQQTIKADDHGTPATFEGVLLADVLAKVDLPLGEKFHGTGASYYLVAKGRDGYRAVFAWAELDPSFMDKAVYVATKKDGKPLPEDMGPFQLVVPGEKRNARWVRQVESLRVNQQTATADGMSEQEYWLTNLLEMQSIKVGMTRADLLKMFMEDGGISEAWHRRYVYRKCPWVKVDVDFPPGKPDDFIGSPGDRIVKISKPYLEPMFFD